jgi:hypothetical protein
MVLRSGIAEHDVEDFATKLGWGRREDTPADPDEGISREVVWYATPQLALHYFDDDESRNACVVVTGGDPEAVRATAEIVESGLDTCRLDDLLDSIDCAIEPEPRARAVLRAGLGAPEEYDERFICSSNPSMTRGLAA